MRALIAAGLLATALGLSLAVPASAEPIAGLRGAKPAYQTLISDVRCRPFCRHGVIAGVSAGNTPRRVGRLARATSHATTGRRRHG